MLCPFVRVDRSHRSSIAIWHLDTRSLLSVQVGFKRELIKEVRLFVLDAQEFRQDWEANGPMVPGLDPMDAVDRLKKFQLMFEVISTCALIHTKQANKSNALQLLRLVCWQVHLYNVRHMQADNFSSCRTTCSECHCDALGCSGIDACRCGSTNGITTAQERSSLAFPSPSTQSWKRLRRRWQC